MNNAASSTQTRWQRLAGNRMLFLLCLVLFLISALFSFWFNFPADLLERRLVQLVAQQTGLKMQGSQASMRFPLGLELDLRVFPDSPLLNPVDLEQLQVSPAWLSLFSGDPGVDLQAGLSTGVLAAQGHKSGGFSLDLQGVAVGPLLRDTLPYQLQGALSGTLSGERDFTENEVRGEFSMELNNAALIGLASLGMDDRLALGRLEVDGKFNQRRLSLERVTLQGGGLDISGGGNLLIGTTPQSTRLNLNIRLHPTQATPQNLRDLLSLTGVKPTTDGSYLFRIGGTLARPAIR